MLRRVMPIVVLLSLGLPATAAGPTPADRCGKIFDAFEPSFVHSWNKMSPALHRIAVSHLGELKTRFVTKCAALPEKDLACGEGKGNPAELMACESVGKAHRAECLRDARADAKNPLKCAGVMRALNAAGELWSKEVLMRDPGFHEALSQMRGGEWPEAAVDTYLKSCMATASKVVAAGKEKAYCGCMLGQLRARLTPIQGAALAAAIGTKKAPPKPVKKVLDKATALCGRI